MERKICPFLGLYDDEKTSLAFPSDGNFCHKADPAAPVSREHQSVYCLTGQHVACPVYMARAAAPLPAVLVSQQSRWERTRKNLRTTILLAVALIFFLAGTWFNGSRLADRMMSLANPFPPSRLDRYSNPSPSVPTEPRSTDTHFSNSSPEPERLVAKECPVPQGWKAHTIQPTDSIFRISIFYGISVEALQKANCLDSQMYLSPGSILYVPIPNPTAMSTATIQPTVAPSPFYVSDTDEDDNSAGINDTPTLIPPTLVPSPEAPVVVPNPDPTQEGKDDGDEKGGDEGDDDEGGDNDDNDDGDDGDENGSDEDDGDEEDEGGGDEDNDEEGGDEGGDDGDDDDGDGDDDDGENDEGEDGGDGDDDDGEDDEGGGDDGDGGDDDDDEDDDGDGGDDGDDDDDD